jgi:hypothetical protein
MGANEIPVMAKMKQLNTARGRKGAWHMKNTTRWDRVDNKATEKAARDRAQFVQDFIFTDTITVDDVASMYCAGLVREVQGTYTFEMIQAVDDVLGIMALGRLMESSQTNNIVDPREAVIRESIKSLGLTG